jgi:hypothetical protein
VVPLSSQIIWNLNTPSTDEREKEKWVFVVHSSFSWFIFVFWIPPSSSSFVPSLTSSTCWTLTRYMNSLTLCCRFVFCLVINRMSLNRNKKIYLDPFFESTKKLLSLINTRPAWMIFYIKFKLISTFPL